MKACVFGGQLKMHIQDAYKILGRSLAVNPPH
jgi:hypothetical protein